MPYPNDFQKRTLWSAGTGLAIVLLGSMLVGIIWLGSTILGYLQPVLVPLAVAGIIAYLLDPVITWLSKSKSITRLRAVLVVLLASLIIVGTFGTFITVKLVEQGNRLTRNRELIGQQFLGTLRTFGWAHSIYDWASDILDDEGHPITRPNPYRDTAAENLQYSKLLAEWREQNNIPVDANSSDELNSEISEDASDDEVEPENAVIENENDPAIATDETSENPPETNQENSTGDPLVAEAEPDEASENEPASESTTSAPSNLPPKPSKPRIYLDAEGDEVDFDKLTAEEKKDIKEYQAVTAGSTFSDTRIGHLLTENGDQLTRTALNWLKASTRLFGVLGYLLGFLLVPVYLFYFLNDSAKIKETWVNYIPLKASKFKDEVIDTLSEINGYLISFFRGQVLVSLIDGVLVGIALSLFGLPYGFLIGLALAILGIIPFIGNILCMVPSAIIAYAHFSDPAHQNFIGSSPWAYVGAVIAIFLVVQQINSLVTAPKIVGDSVGLHPMTVIFSILFWSLILGGFLGALLAVPLTAAVKVLFSRYIWQTKISPQLGDSSNLNEQSTIPNNL